MRQKKFRLLPFAGNISQETVGRFKLARDDGFDGTGGYSSQPIGGVRFLVFYGGILLVFFVLVGRLFVLTIVSGDKYRQYAEGNRIQIVETEAERGRVFDRHNKLIAQSKRIYFLEKGQEKIAVSQQQAQELQKQGLAGENFEGELGKINQEVRREYLLGESASHLIGYTSVVSKEDLAKGLAISAVESIGRLGIEESYDDFIRGKPGKKLVEVDALGSKIAILGKVDPMRGRDVYLTIDADLQKRVFEGLAKQADKVNSRKGAAVVQNPQTGEVLALVSVPAFDGEDIGRFVADLEKPFLNRVTAGMYPPGSVFKIVSSLAGLESGKITKDTQIEDVGEFELGGSRFANWYFLQYGKVDGVLGIVRAIARSNDIFFYRLGERVGLNKIREMAVKLGFGQKTGIDLPAEGYGLLPDEVWKESTIQQDWFLGDTLHMAIGQGFILTTPIQVNGLVSFMATGKLNKPYVVSKIDKDNQSREITIEPQALGENLVASENFEVVRDGMKQACQTGGTGWPFFNAPYTVGCKTGTAERALGNPHAWFTAFAPFEDPKVAITVIIENGGEGSSMAGPVAREILDWWFENRSK